MNFRLNSKPNRKFERLNFRLDPKFNRKSSDWQGIEFPIESQIQSESQAIDWQAIEFPIEPQIQVVFWILF